MQIDFNEREEIDYSGMEHGTGSMTAKVFEEERGKAILCTLHPGSSIGMHRHDDSDDFVYVISGRGKAICDGVEEELTPGICHVCFAGSQHEVINTGDEDLRLLSVVAGRQIEQKQQHELDEAYEMLKRAYGAINGFSQEYHTIWVVDKDTLKMHLIRSTGVSTIKGAVQIGMDYPDFDTGFEKYINTYVEPEDRKRMQKKLASAEVLKQLEKKGIYSVNYLRRDEEGHVGYHQITFANADSTDGSQEQFVYGFRDIDKLLKEEKEKKQELLEAKRLAESRAKDLSEQLEIVRTIVKAFNVVYYINMEDGSFIQLGVNMDGIEDIIGAEGNAKEAFGLMYEHLVDPDQVEEIKTFTNLSTLNRRLKKQNWIAIEFHGPVGGWSEGIFVAADRGEDGRLRHVIWATRNIDEKKKREENLFRQSNTDELTGLYNRRAYEEALSEYDASGIPENLVYVSMDINGLKSVNDNFGHAAGDELILGAVECMKQCFGPYGRLYRTGGDEFMGLLLADREQVEGMKKEIAEATADWRGKLVNTVSISCGYIPNCGIMGLSMHEIAVLADHRMYEAKSRHYRELGVDRREKRD